MATDRKWIRIALYVLIAFSMSFLARVHWQTSGVSDPGRGVAAMSWHLLGGVGPFLGAVAVWLIFRPARPITYGGTCLPISIAMLAVPAGVLGATGIPNGFSVEPHVFGAYMGLLIVFYAILEETGWRGYLQSEFQDRAPLLRYAIVGLVWYAWHFSYLGGNPIDAEIFTLLVLLGAAIGIGFVADRTRSIFAAASFHAAGNIMAMSADFKALIPSAGTRGLIVAVCVGIWLVMMRVWRLRETRSRSANGARTTQ
jgi:membrane protease YdiL (CAAX protease family)